MMTSHQAEYPSSSTEGLGRSQDPYLPHEGQDDDSHQAVYPSSSTEGLGQSQGTRTYLMKARMMTSHQAMYPSSSAEGLWHSQDPYLPHEGQDDDSHQAEYPSSSTEGLGHSQDTHVYLMKARMMTVTKLSIHPAVLKVWDIVRTLVPTS